MATEKRMNTRVQLKNDIEANWNLATGFTPRDGELIIYDIDENYTYPRFKVGNGNDNVINLPFAVLSWNDLINKPIFSATDDNNGNVTMNFN
jgi:hypothetical protein